MFEMMTSWLLIEHLYGKTFVPPTGGTIYERISRPIGGHSRPRMDTSASCCTATRIGCSSSNAIGQPELMKDPRYGGDFFTRTAYAGELYGLVASEMLSERTPSGSRC